jgi:hypothetical protein
MPLDPKYLNSAVRITSAGDLLGTGSVVTVKSETIKGVRWPYVLTAHHVIKNQVAVELEVPDPLTYGVIFPPIPCDAWRQPLPGVDLAIAPFPEHLLPRWQAVELESFVPEGRVVPLGGQIHYIGMFAPLNVPMGRSASLGALDVPIVKDDYAYQADLVDCRSYGGFSGSPCFSTMAYAILDKPVTLPAPFTPLREDGSMVKLGQVSHVASFCGIFTAHYTDEGVADGVVSRYGVGVMLPCDDIRVALMTDEAKNERRLADDEWTRRKAAEGPPLVDAGAAEGESESEWDRFENLTRQLVHTPKPPR